MVTDDKILVNYLTKIMANQTTTIEILCSMIANGNDEKKNELMQIALTQSQLYHDELLAATQHF